MFFEHIVIDYNDDDGGDGDVAVCTKTYSKRSVFYSIT